jgi:glycosyltransferase involved in cell wall biosynthesis
LKSVDFANEVILVDCSSTDKTAEIAKEAGAKVFKRENNLMLNVNKNYGFTKAENEWILNLDADERVTTGLREEIEKILKSSTDITAFSIPRKNIIFGKWIRHTGWYPDLQTRLFRRGKAKFPEVHVHEQIKVDGEISELTSPLDHESYASVMEFLLKFFTIYAPNEADVLIKDNEYNFSASDFLTRPSSEFINRFYNQKGYKDGLHGLALSLLMAFYHFVVVALIWEKKDFTESGEDMRKVVDENAGNIKKELKYWDLQSKAEGAGLVKSFFYRLRRKISS